MNFSAVSPPESDSFLFFDIMLSRRILNLVILLIFGGGALEQQLLDGLDHKTAFELAFGEIPQFSSVARIFFRFGCDAPMLFAGKTR